MPLPVVLDTDIGTDIDDAYALVLAAVSSELDLRAVTTVNHDTFLRAKIAKKLLRLMGRDDVPVAAGARDSLTPGETRGWIGHEGQGMDLADIGPGDLCGKSVPDLLRVVLDDLGPDGPPLTLLAIGALTNVAWLLEALPLESVARIGGVIAMASSFEGFGAENARAEHNVACDPVAAQRVLASGLPVTLVGLNVTLQTTMSTEQVDGYATRGGPLAKALAGMHRVWFDFLGRDHSPMHDGLAVAAAFRPDVLTLEPVVPQVSLEPSRTGVIAYNPPAAGQVASCRIASTVDADAYHRLLHERILHAIDRTGGGRKDEG